MTLPQLLQEAEHELREASVAGSVSGGSPERELAPVSPALASPAGFGLGFQAHANAYATPARRAVPQAKEDEQLEPEAGPSGWQETFFDTPVQAPAAMPTLEMSPPPTPAPVEANPLEYEELGPREWQKDDWKLLDACYTDVRLDTGIRLGLPGGSLADVDSIPLDAVVDRFCESVPIRLLGWDRSVVLSFRRATSILNHVQSDDTSSRERAPKEAARGSACATYACGCVSSRDAFALYARFRGGLLARDPITDPIFFPLGDTIARSVVPERGR
jgi:hypothetical protein